ncbi:pentapeptide repeat-containing protein [Gorillibacterium sp. sgz5001074]|uniref:pentapeptide repeat-containing protein n=1 Tax=Gorillibacterium sp. sgz5001074 TaxID=3446695 RepID=UPI003F6779BF
MSHEQHPNNREAEEGFRPADLITDCTRCFGLCCVALPFAASSDFAKDKRGGDPCHNLQPDFRCGVHTKLRDIGFRGCTVYDCFGAGQRVSQLTFGGRDWRQAPETAKKMFEVFPVMRQLHELLRYLAEALTFTPAQSLHGSLRSALEETDRYASLGPDELLALDVPAHRARVSELLLEASELVRQDARRRAANPPKPRKNVGRGADLIGAKLRGADLRFANLRGAYLIAADLRDADLRMADLIGADLRDTDLRGARLTDSLFLTQAQLNAARGDASTKLPSSLTRPEHWSK